MELIYTTRTTGFEGNKHYRNPMYFERPERQAKTVKIEGDFPKIVSAYQKIGVAVDIITELPKGAEKELDISKLKVDELKAKLTEKGISFEPNAKKEDLIALLTQNNGGNNDPEYSD